MSKILSVFSIVLICGVSCLKAQTKTRVSGAANWNTASTWIQLRTGTIAFTNASKTVTGTGTSFTTQLQVGDVLMLDATPGTIRGTVASITSNTSLQLVANASATASTAAYGRQTIPGATDNVQIGNTTIAAAANITLDVSSTITSLTFIADDVAHSLTHNGTYSLGISGTVTINQPTANSITNSWNINGGSSNVSGLISFAGTSTSSRISKVAITSGSLDANTGISFAGTTPANKVIDMSGGAGILYLEGNLSGSANATLTAGILGSIVNYDDNVAQTISMFGAGGYYNLYTNNTSAGGATLGAAITTTNVKGDVKVLSGTFYNGGFAIALNLLKVFEVANGATFKLTGTSGMVTGTTITKTFGASSTVEYAGTGTQTISAESYGNLSSSSTGGRTLASSGTIGIAGSFTPGTNTYTTTGSTVSFNGSSSQNIPAFTFNNLTINNGSDVTLTGNVSISGTTNALTFSNGKVITGSNTLTLAAATTISGAGAGDYVYGNLRWNFSTGAQTKTFIVGDATNYTPVTVAFASVSVANSLTVNVTATEHPNLSGSGIRTDESVDRYWTITNNGITFTTATLTFNWVSGDVDAGATTSAFKVGKYINPTWTIASVASATSTSIQATAVTSFGDFAIGELCAVSNAFSYPGTPYCSSAGSATPTITGSAGTFTSTAGLSINTATGVVNLAASTAGTYTVTNTSLGGCASSATATIVVTLQPYATGSYPGSPYCYNAGIAYPTGSSNSTGTLSSTAGLTIDEYTGAVNLSTSTPGTYSVTYTVPASGGCATYTTSYPITIIGAPSATISYSGSPFCNTGTATVTRSGTSGGTYSSTAGLSINSSTGQINLAASTIGTYTITYSGSVCGSYSATTTISVVGAGTWTGAVSNSWNTSGNWTCSTIPTATTNVIIPSGLSTYPTISSGVTGSINNLTLQSGATITLNGAMQIKGTITNSGSITATSGAVTMNGTSAQTIPAGLFSSNTVNDLIINNTAGVTLAGTLNLTNLLTVSNGGLTTGGYLTLKATSTTTARVSEITSVAATPIAGNVTVERYIQGRRKYRLVTSSVTTSSSGTLTTGQESLSIWGNWQNQGNTTTGNVGTIITGGTTANGFDQQSTNPSLYTYNTATKRFVAFSTANGKNTKYTPLTAGVPYYMFVYGDRVNSITTSTPNNTILKATGTLLTGNLTYNTSSSIPLTNIVGDYTLLGNPYAAIIDWSHVQTTNLSGTMWAWDANLSSTGGYATITNNILGAIISPLSGLIRVSQYIQPGQAFFVRTTGSNPQLTFRESDKVDAVGNVVNSVFREANVKPLMALNLLYNNAGTTMLADGAVAAFDASFSNEFGNEDGIKMTGSTEGIALQHGTDLLSIDARQIPQNSDTMFLNMSRLTKPQYTLEIFSQQMDGLTAKPYLEDNYLNTSVPLSVTDTNRIVFNVSAADPASSADNRFRIVFKQMDVLPVTFASIQATLKEKYIQVEWKVVSESGIKTYEVERSADGIRFTKIAEVAAKNSNTAEIYQWLDANPLPGNNYYHIRAVQQDGKIYLTKIVAAKIVVPAKATLVVFPNPIQNREIKFVQEAIVKGQYTLQLYSAEGQLIMTRLFDYNGGVSHQVVQLDKNLSVGVYYLTIRDQNNVFHQTVFVDQ